GGGERLAGGDRDDRADAWTGARGHARPRHQGDRRTSRLVSMTTGYGVQPNKAVVGASAFAHESGIHQHGVLSNRATYEIMDPLEIGLEGNRLVLGKHSGRHAFVDALQNLGITLEDVQPNRALA